MKSDICSRCIGLCGILLLGLLASACAQATPAPTVAPTSTPTPFPTFAYIQPTTAPRVAAGATEAAATATTAVGQKFVIDADKASYGLGRWEALDCGECHGTQGAGTERGPSLLAWTAAEEDFINFMRSGGNLGRAHRYPAERLSAGGASNLYHYLRSLGS